MGLKFCNEAIIALKQIWPASNEKEPLSPLQVSCFHGHIFHCLKSFIHSCCHRFVASIQSKIKEDVFLRQKVFNTIRKEVQYCKKFPQDIKMSNSGFRIPRNFYI